jgi:hypothetical protein
MSIIDRLVEEAIEEELGGGLGAGLGESFDGAESDPDWAALLHGLGQVWQSLPPETRAFLMGEAWRRLKRAVQDPKGAFRDTVAQIGGLTRTRGLLPLDAARQATAQVIARRKARVVSRKGPTAAFKLAQRKSKYRWQRGRRGDRLEAWI